MKVVCSQSELHGALQLVSRAVASRPTHPVLANVLIKADAGTDRVNLTGFDLNLGIQTALSAAVESSGAITLPARLLVEIVSRLPSDSPVTLSGDLEMNQVELTSLSGSYQMRGMPADDFPELSLVENGTALKVLVEPLVKALRSTLFASSSDEAKQLLTGVHLRFSRETLEAACTDGHRLAVLTVNDALQMPREQDDKVNELSVTLPARSLRVVERLMASWHSREPVSLFCDRGQVVFLTANQIVTSRILEGTYPNYQQLIPDTFSHNIQLNRRGFIAALERVAVLADQHNKVINIESDLESSSISISTDAQDVGSGLEFLSAEFDDEPVKIAFNVRYILEGLKAMEGERVTLRCNGSTAPAILTPGNGNSPFTYLVMPVQMR